MARRTEHLLTGHLEGIRADVFVQFPQVITSMVAGHHGLYALYSGDRLYYVGLARDLKNRLKTHLRDRHKKLWDRFSVYITGTDEHIKELESLMLRVMQPEGNRVRGKLQGSKDKRRELDRAIKQEQDKKRFGILGKKVREQKPRGQAKNKRNGQDLHRHGASGAVFLRAEYKGRSYKAVLRQDGTIQYNGNSYSSLSAAGKAITKRSTNGRHFWRVKDAQGAWVRLSDIGG